jgi:hypothetical protein
MPGLDHHGKHPLPLSVLLAHCAVLEKKAYRILAYPEAFAFY